MGHGLGFCLFPLCLITTLLTPGQCLCLGKLFNIDNTRFFTYAGLVVATCIILHKNWLVASGVGVVVAAYISFTEYYLANNDISGDLQPTPATLDTIKQQFQQGNFGPM